MMFACVSTGAKMEFSWQLGNLPAPSRARATPQALKAGANELATASREGDQNDIGEHLPFLKSFHLSTYQSRRQS